MKRTTVLPAMSRNLGSLDRGLRVAIGLSILGLGFARASYGGLLGLIPLVTGLVGWCPLYCPFKLRTCRRGAGGCRAA